MKSQIDSIKYNNPNSEVVYQNSFIISEFPEYFITKLESELYPNWYVACFMTENKNSAVWGHYGDSHKGVCLKFKTNTKGEDKLLSLETTNGYSSKDAYMKRKVDHKFHKVNYSNENLEIEFFKALARMPQAQLERYWFCNERGCFSDFSDHLLKDNIDEWRKKYWENHMKVVTNKVEEWSCESEYRLVFTEVLIDYSSVERRKLKYDFNDLEEIIFGIKTPEEDKLKIIEIVKEKCKQYDRSDFKFSQATYSPHDRRIVFNELNIICE
ncbi:DUF2971 domain-containing protein [Clostridium tagluense]|uniref:DUF2971 domain-containing protein n=1 Tax=Clostridium tagluense TaxID=360422 RepID=UPI001CF25F29|nr:DUF2971 domain-containing protein [Clostridium tagluense]MCB2300123.1 DUF2971 domain-containing protein [Clostridium tagluense]